MKFDTTCVHAGWNPQRDEHSGAVMCPVVQSTTYVQHAPGKPYPAGHEYSRASNPTRSALEAALAALEGGEWALAFSSGMSAADAVLRLLKPGDHVVAGSDLYGGTHRLFSRVCAPMGVRFAFVDSSRPGAVEEAILPETRLIWVETPSNPMLRVTDLAAVAEAGRKRGVITTVDNTFASPALQNPLALGIDLVVHSTTKYLGGHSDVVGGAVIGRDPEHRARLAFLQKAVGAVPGPMDCYLVQRGIKTLALRMARHGDNALRVARFLEAHPRVRKVHYPGLESHAGFELAKRQMKNPGGMISFELDGEEAEARALVSRTRIFLLAESLGGVESLIEHPPSMTHADATPESKRTMGLADTLIRLSVGIEDAEDLIGDLRQALAN